MPRTIRYAGAAARAKTWFLTEKDLAQSWTRHRLAASPADNPAGSTATGSWRFLARGSADPLGLRKSHLQIFLYGTKFRKSAGTSAESEVSSLSKALQQIAGRLDSQQFLLALRIAVDFGASLNWSAPLVNQPRHARYLCRHPGKLIKVIDTIYGEGTKDKKKPEGVRHYNDYLWPFSQQLAVLIAERSMDFGHHILKVFCTLVHHAGRLAFRKVREEQMAAVVQQIWDQRGDDGNKIKWTSYDAAELFCAVHRLGLQMTTATLTTLTRIIRQDLQEVRAENLPILARALGKGDWHEEFVLLHAICRQGSLALQEGVLKAQAACTFILVCSHSKWEIFDEELLQSASRAFEDGSKDLSTKELCDVIYSVGSFQVRDVIALDGICAELTQRAEDRKLAEADMVKLARGLLKLRYRDETLMNALAPLVLESKQKMMPVSLCNLIAAFSYFGSSSEDFYVELLTSITDRASKLQPISVQHILTALCRLQGRVASEKLKMPLERLCEHIAQLALSASFSPVQAMSSLSALANLQQRDLASASVFASVLCGTSEVHWHWAKSPQCVRQLRSMDCSSFQEAKCRAVMDQLDSSRCVEILQSLSSLELNSRLTCHLTALLCSLLAPQLHDLRAKEVIVVARAFSPERIPDVFWSRGQLSGAHPRCLTDGSINSEGPSRWRERALDLCFQSLRRHEHFLDTTYFALLPFKLLCLQVNLGTFGTRKLEEFLNPMLLAFVDRLRSLTKEECEANRARREGEDEEGESFVLTEPMDPGPEEIDCESGHRILLGSYLGDLQVLAPPEAQALAAQLLAEAVPAI